MQFVEQIGSAIVTSIRSEASVNEIISNIENGIKLSTGDPFAALAIISKAIEQGGNITNLLFYNKLREFLISIDTIPLRDRVKFLAKYFNGKKEEEFAKKLIEEIDDISDSDKVKFIFNAFRGLVYDKITVELFYRIVDVIKKSLYQDLIYLRDNINRKTLEPTIEITALNNLGLMFMSSISNNKEQNRYDFLHLAYVVVNYAILGDEADNRYLNQEQVMQVTQVPGVEWTEIEW